MTALAILALLGALLLLVAIFGGERDKPIKFPIAGQVLEVPQVRRATQVLCGGIGSLLILIVIWLSLPPSMQVLPSPGSTLTATAPWTAAATTAYTPTPINTATAAPTAMPTSTSAASPTMLPTLSPTPTPTVVPTLKPTVPSPTTVSISDMEMPTGWTFFKDGQSIVTGIGAVEGRTGRALRVGYELRPGQMVFIGISKLLAPGMLAGITSIGFYYKNDGRTTGDGKTNTIELKLVTTSQTIYSYSWEMVSTTDWVPVEIPIELLSCSCGSTLKLEQVERIDIAISHQLAEGPFGAGSVILDDVYGVK